MTRKKLEQELYNQIKLYQPYDSEAVMKAHIDFIIDTKLKLINKRLINEVSLIKTETTDDGFNKYTLWLNEIEMWIEFYLCFKEEGES